MIVHVKLFASAKDQACADTIALSVSPGAPLSFLRQPLDDAAPALRGMPGRWAVNLDFAPNDYAVKSGDECAWIPPVSGG